MLYAHPLRLSRSMGAAAASAFNFKSLAPSDLSLQDIDFDFVPSSYPGEEDSFWLGQYTGTTEDLVVDFTPARQTDLGFYCEQSTEMGCPRLVRRASPDKPRPAGTSPAASIISATPIPRSSKLVRRVTVAPDLERRRQRAREEAGRIVKKLGSLTKTMGASVASTANCTNS
ncbi:hypothetical protein B0H10DRAFT_2228439 [Mycena sp. CBHHK59/15]|nr:hypothetical protein B0H10DRAFT_2228439 [Mycena sp. CBHHK59/15]